MRNEYCLEHIEQVIENCGLSDRQVRELRQTTKFRASHGEISPLSNGAIMPLIRVKDPAAQTKAIESVVKELEVKGGRLTAKKVKAIVEQFEPVVEPGPELVVESMEPQVEEPEVEPEQLKPKKPIEVIQEAIEDLFEEGLGAARIQEMLQEAFNHVLVRVQPRAPESLATSGSVNSDDTRARGGV